MTEIPSLKESILKIEEKLQQKGFLNACAFQVEIRRLLQEELRAFQKQDNRNYQKILEVSVKFD